MFALIVFISSLFSVGSIDTIKILASDSIHNQAPVMDPYNAACAVDTCVVLPMSVMRKTVTAVAERNFFAEELSARVVSDSLLRARISIDSSELVLVRTQLVLSKQNEVDLKYGNEKDRKKFFLFGAGIGFAAASSIAILLVLIGIN